MALRCGERKRTAFRKAEGFRGGKRVDVHVADQNIWNLGVEHQEAFADKRERAGVAVGQN